MVEGGDTTPSSQLEGTASTYKNVGLDASDAVDDDTEALLNNLSIPRHLPSIIDIKRALPQHVFVPDVRTSMYYVLKDVVQVVGLFCVAEFIWSKQLLPTWALIALLPAYWLLQGTFFMAIFVIGHDAGHSCIANSNYNWLNDTVGTIFHTFLLCPYYCWKLSHRHHHKNTNNIDKEEVFYPIRKKDDPHTTVIPALGLGIGWFGYLLVGYGTRPVSHFNPFHSILKVHFGKCVLSIMLVVAWAAVLLQYGMSAGFLKLFVHFVVPDYIFGTHAVVLTVLQHTDDGIPWYADSVWDNVRGQLSTVDRHYGWCHDIMHNASTHQVHHLFSKIPHYHAEEATRVFRQKFPELAHYRHERILPAFFRVCGKFLKQRIVPDSVKVHLYK